MHNGHNVIQNQSIVKNTLRVCELHRTHVRCNYLVGPKATAYIISLIKCIIELSHG